MKMRWFTLLCLRISSTFPTSRFSFFFWWPSYQQLCSRRSQRLQINAALRVWGKKPKNKIIRPNSPCRTGCGSGVSELFCGSNCLRGFSYTVWRTGLPVSFRILEYFVEWQLRRSDKEIWDTKVDKASSPRELRGNLVTWLPKPSSSEKCLRPSPPNLFGYCN